MASASVIGGRSKLLIGVWVHGSLLRKYFERGEALDAELATQLFLCVAINGTELSHKNIDVHSGVTRNKQTNES